jgi:hypothetical protein
MTVCMYHQYWCCLCLQQQATKNANATSWRGATWETKEVDNINMNFRKTGLRMEEETGHDHIQQW